MITNPLETTHCRLCRSATSQVFTRTVLFTHQVAYFHCPSCGGLQTEFPYWLTASRVPQSECFNGGNASQILTNFLLLRRVLEILNVRPKDRCVDFAGESGLFSRLMRDIGYQFFNFSKVGVNFTNAEFCVGGTWDKFNRSVRLTTIFNKAENFIDPLAEWDAIFSTTTDYILGSTEIYSGQDSNWDYLAPESGQRTFFYSPATLAQIAMRHRWSAYTLGNYFLLARAPLSAAQVNELMGWSQSLDSVANESFLNWFHSHDKFTPIDSQRMKALASLRAAGVRIAIDGVFFRIASGISRVWRSLLAEWSANGFGEFLVIIDRMRTAPRFAGISYLDAPAHDYANRPTDRRLLQDICDREKITLFTSTYYTTPLTTPSILMVHDMIPEVMGFDLTNEQWREKHDALRYCQNYVAVSHSTMRDLLRFYPNIIPQQIVVTHGGTDFSTPSTEQIAAFKQKYNIERPYFILSGSKTDYKNALLFFRAFAHFGINRANFAIVCTHSIPPLEPEFQEHVGSAQVHHLVLSDAELQCAYAGALALAYPSRYEGFGLPVLEAMSCSCPVITCNNSSLGEVGGDAVVYVNPDSVTEMEIALDRVCQETTRRELIAKGLVRADNFSWRKMADGVENALIHWALKIKS